MKKMFVILLALMLCSCSAVQDKPSLTRNSPELLSYSDGFALSDELEDNYRPINYSTVKAIWISYIELAPIISKGEEIFTDEFAKMCDNCVSLGINTLYVHVRTFSDSFYPSKLYPYSKAYGGIYFDALEIMLNAAHERGLSFHAWINPLRCESKQGLQQLSRSVINEWLDDPEKYPQYVSYVDGTSHYWLDPGSEEVRKLIAEGAGEIVSNYPVDGVHIDDYFYPTTDKRFDDKLYEKSGKDLSLDEWRLNNCTQMVKSIYETVKKENPKVEFGISPQGNVANNYNYMYADVKRWCTEEGYCDYIVPQCYFGYNNPHLPFLKAFEEWLDICKDRKVKLMIGVGAYKVNSEDEFINDVGIVASQAECALNSMDGVALFSYNSLFGSERGLEEEKIIAELFKITFDNNEKSHN